MLFSWFKLPMTWNAAAYHEEWKSTSEYPYFGCYLFHSFKNILKPWVVCPETKYAGSPVSQNFEIPAVQQQEWWKLQGDLTWHGILHAGMLLALLSALCPGTPDSGRVLETLLLVHQRFTDVITIQDEIFQVEQVNSFPQSQFCWKVFYNVCMEKAGRCTYVNAVIKAGLLKTDI